jgi:hypothetical protein
MKILFLCLARNCEKTLPGFFLYLRSLEQHGMICSAIIGENGSRDHTRTLIERTAHQGIELLDTGFMTGIPDRLTRMAAGRQALLEKSLQKSHLQLICVADLDNVMLKPPSPGSFASAAARLQRDPTLFAVGATSYPVYYDLLSFRNAQYDFSTLNVRIQAAKRAPLTYFRFHHEHIYRHQRTITYSKPLVCDSSFNGLCIYNAGDYRLGSYRAPDEKDVCEHVSMNISIARATDKRMLVAPELRLATPADHGPVGFVRFWYDRIKERVC